MNERCRLSIEQDVCYEDMRVNDRGAMEISASCGSCGTRKLVALDCDANGAKIREGVYAALADVCMRKHLASLRNERSLRDDAAPQPPIKTFSSLKTTTLKVHSDYL